MKQRAVLGAVATAVVAVAGIITWWRRIQPEVTPVSSEWLAAHTYDTGKDGY